MKEMTRRPRQDEAAWRRLLARHAESGLSTEAFCAEAGVSSKSFYRWRSRLSGSTPKPVAVAATSGKPSANGFIDLGGLHRPGGPHALLTGLGLFSFDRARRRFRLESLHPGHSVEEIRDNTGFEFDSPAHVPSTLAPDASTLAAIRNRIRGDIAETYPHFATKLSAA